MTIEEVLNLYKIPPQVLEKYQRYRLDSNDQFTDIDIHRLSEMMMLHDIGFTDIEIKRYMERIQNKEVSQRERVKLLNGYRKKLLDEIHFKERQIERIDYLKREIKEI